MTRHRRGLEIMAGIRETPFERQKRLLDRRIQKLNTERARDLQLIDMIQRRQKGESGLKPMPLAAPEENK